MRMARGARLGAWGRGFAPLLLWLVLSALASAGVTAQDGAGALEGAGLTGEALDAQTRAVSAELRCPVCQGESIQDSPADLAVEMRAVVRDQLAAGRTPAEVKGYFVERYGEWILLAPPARGFNLLLYVLPFVLIVGGGVGLFLAARRWQGRSPAASAERAQRPVYVGPEEDEY